MVHPDTKRKLHVIQCAKYPEYKIGHLVWNETDKLFILPKFDRGCFIHYVPMKDIKYNKETNSATIPSSVEDYTYLIIDMSDAKFDITIEIHNNVYKVIGDPNTRKICIKVILMDKVYPILQLFHKLSIQNNPNYPEINLGNIHSISRAPGSGYIHRLVRCGTFYDYGLESVVGCIHYVVNHDENLSDSWDLYPWIHYPSGNTTIPHHEIGENLNPSVVILYNDMNYDSDKLIIGIKPIDKMMCQCYEIDVVHKLSRDIIIIPVENVIDDIDDINEIHLKLMNKLRYLVCKI